MTSLPKHCCSGATPIFIVSSGRSGTRALENAISASADVTTHHEYMVNIIQPVAVRYWMHLTGRSEALKILGQTYGAAIKYAETPIWVDSSNKTSWVIDLLAELFPNARFVHLVRDGRKVVSSYFHKLGNECYDDRSTAILAKYADGSGTLPRLTPPPPEKNTGGRFRTDATLPLKPLNPGINSSAFRFTGPRSIARLSVRSKPFPTAGTSVFILKTL